MHVFKSCPHSAEFGCLKDIGPIGKQRKANIFFTSAFHPVENSRRIAFKNSKQQASMSDATQRIDR